MTSTMWRVAIGTLVLLMASAADVGARGGRGGGGGFARGGAAARGSFGHGADDWQGRHEQRQQRRDHRQERREDGQGYADDSYGVYYDDGYYPDEGVEDAGDLATPPWWTLDCEPDVVEVDGTTYYHCESTWYARVYEDGDVAYAIVDPPPGY